MDHASKLILGEKIYEKAESYMVAHDKDGERCLVDPQMFLQVWIDLFFRKGGWPPASASGRCIQPLYWLFSRTLQSITNSIPESTILATYAATLIHMMKGC